MNYEKWRNRGLVLFVVFAFLSCDIQKQASKTKTDTETNEQYERIEKREGGTTTFKPESTIIYRDTTIYVQGTNGTELKVIYDKSGNASQFDCKEALIDITERYNKQQQETVKQKDSEKTEKFNSDWILYILGGIVIIGIFIVFMFFRSINTQGKAINGILQTLAELKK